MSFQLPEMPAPFLRVAPNDTQPNPRNVRGSDMTWFNTSGSNIVMSNFNTCTADTTQHFYPWGYSTQPAYQPFDLKPVGGKSTPCNSCGLIQRFDLYGLVSKCKCALDRCGGCKNSNQPGCSKFGCYVNPN